VPGQGHVINRLACPSPNVKRPRTRLAESEQMAARTNPRDGGSGSGSSVEKDDGGHDEEDPTPFLETTSRDLDSETSTSIVGLPNEKLQEAEREQMTARTNPRDGAIDTTDVSCR
jgi:hypothetical protein